MSATHVTESTAPQTPVLYVAFELGLATWKLAFTVGAGQKPRIGTIPACLLHSVKNEIKLANKRFGLPEETTVISCFEAVRDSFWLHRFLVRSEGHPVPGGLALEKANVSGPGGDHQIKADGRRLSDRIAKRSMA